MPALKRSFVETTDRAALLWIRWLFFLVLTFLFLYTYQETAAPLELVLKSAVLVFYAVSNAVLLQASRKEFSIARWSSAIFIFDMALVSLMLYFTAGPDKDLYLMSFLMVYLATLSRRMRDALPITLIVCLLYGMLLAHKNPDAEWLDPQLLLRFPFFLVLGLFTSYLTEQTERQRQRLQQMKLIQDELSRELAKALADLQAKQAALIQAEKMTAMGHMAGALAHDIRNPLSVIIGYVQDFLDGRPADDPLIKPMQAVRRAAQQCFDLMQNLLNFSRRPKSIDTFKIKDAMDECFALLTLRARKANVAMTLDARVDPLISGRRSEIQQIFINLMGNAIDAMPNGGPLTVRIEHEFEADQPWIVVTVKDTGEGISESARPHLFEPFFTTKEAGYGTGLGLSIVLDIVQSYQGLIEVDSTPGQGATFTVRLPAATADALAKAA